MKAHRVFRWSSRRRVIELLWDRTGALKFHDAQAHLVWAELNRGGTLGVVREPGAKAMMR